MANVENGIQSSKKVTELLFDVAVDVASGSVLAFITLGHMLARCDQLHYLVEHRVLIY